MIDFQLDGQETLAGKVYDFEELESVDKGIAPAFNDDVQVIGSDSEDDLSWDSQSMLIAKSVSSHRRYIVTAVLQSNFDCFEHLHPAPLQILPSFAKLAIGETHPPDCEHSLSKCRFLY